jgi:polysaccharide export outer membrane protein
MREVSPIAVLLLTLFATLGAAAPQQPAPDAAAPKPAAPAPVDNKTYQIGPEDVLLIRVWREPELSGTFTVRPDGRISLPLVNEIQAAPSTPEELAAAIAKGLGKYMNQPEVSVSVQQINSKKYFIIGEVVRPGPYPLTVKMTVLEALTNAGNFRDFANPKKIIILRKGQRLKFNYKDVIKGKKPEQNVTLENGDQIIVP